MLLDTLEKPVGTRHTAVKAIDIQGDFRFTAAAAAGLAVSPDFPKSYSRRHSCA